MKDRLLVFDLIRVFAIFIILFHHLPAYCFNFYDLNWLGIHSDWSMLNEMNRYFGLGLFVFTSGYLLNLKKRTFSGWQTAQSFLFRKLLRILPLYCLSLILFCWMYNMDEPLRIITHVFGLQLLFRTDSFFPMRTLWFVGMIIPYYALFVLLKIDTVRRLYKVLLLTFVPIFVLAMGLVFDLMDLRLALYYGIFFFGIFCAETDVLAKMSRAILLTFFSTLALCLLLYGDLEFLELPFESVSTFTQANALMLCFVLAVYSIFSYLVEHIKDSRAIEMIAYSSYGAYLFHRPVWFFLEKAIAALNIDSRYTAALILVAIGIPLIILVSNVLQTLYDEYCLKPLSSRVLKP
ncbi:MAG: acyltransferase [Leptolyngbya sp. SIO1D8]|nr:acyltransferase [Leptolyngbya sp. SIO1D8]